MRSKTWFTHELSRETLPVVLVCAPWASGSAVNRASAMHGAVAQLHDQGNEDSFNSLDTTAMTLFNAMGSGSFVS